MLPPTYYSSEDGGAEASRWLARGSQSWGGACGARLCDVACFARTVRALEQQLLPSEEQQLCADRGKQEPSGAREGETGPLDYLPRKRSPRRGSAATLAVLTDSAEPRVGGRGWGVACAVFSVIVWAPDGVFVSRLKASTKDQSDEVVVLWKWLLVSVICGSAVLLQLWRDRAQDRAECLRTGSTLRPFLQMGSGGWHHMLLGAGGVVVAGFHTLGLLHAAPSIAVMLFYLNPMWCAPTYRPPAAVPAPLMVRNQPLMGAT